MIPKRVSVSFRKPWRGYNAGEVAGFKPGTAEVLISEGYAQEYPKRSMVTKAVSKAVEATKSKSGKAKGGKGESAKK